MCRSFQRPSRLVAAVLYLEYLRTIPAIKEDKIEEKRKEIRKRVNEIFWAQLDEMAQVFVVPRWKAFRHVVLPQLAPFIAAAARSGLSLVWKIVLVVELLGRPNGVGFEIGIAFQLFDVTRILAYALAFVAVVLAIEILLVQRFERRASRWRSRTA